MDSNDIKVREFISQYIKKNDILIDVGANEGEYTDFFKQILNGTGKIYSIELHPETFKKICKKFEEDKNIECLNLAISDIDGERTYFSGRDSFTHNIIGHDMNFKSNTPLGLIESKRLDSIFKEYKIIDFLKVDVEGAELMVLNGLSGIFNKINYILIECHLDEDWNNIRKILLNDYKYDCINVISSEIINESSKRAYQCFCKQKHGN